MLLTRLTEAASLYRKLCLQHTATIRLAATDAATATHSYAAATRMLHFHKQQPQPSSNLKCYINQRKSPNFS